MAASVLERAKEEVQTESQIIELEDMDINLEFRLSAKIVQLRNSGGYELVSMWIGQVVHSTTGKTELAYIQEYLRLGQGDQVPEQVQDDESDFEDGFGYADYSLSTVMKENDVDYTCRQDDYSPTLNRLETCWPVLNINPSRSDCKYHVLALSKRQTHDRVIVMPPLGAKDPVELRSTQRDWRQRRLSGDAPYVERLTGKGEGCEDDKQDQLETPPSYFSTTLTSSKSVAVVREPPNEFSAKDKKHCTLWFNAVLSLELACARDDMAARIMEWFKNLEAKAEDSAKRNTSFQTFKTAITHIIDHPDDHPGDLKRHLMVCWDCLVKDEDDPMYRWLE